MPKKDYINIKFEVFEEYYDICMSIFLDYDFCGIEEGVDELIATFEESAFNEIDVDYLLSELQSYDPNAKIKSIEKISDKNWNEEWESHVQPVIVSDRIVITPTHRAEEFDCELKIVIDPKMSFGTGHHNTTRLMCKLMDGLVEKGSHWIDVGTGTGVLAILASKLGAKDVYAFDNNEWSIENAEENILKNDCNHNIRLKLDDIDSIDLENCNGIAANIFINLAVPSLGKFKKAVEKSNGDILISGIMIYDEKLLIDKAKEHDLELISRLTEGEWGAYHFRCKDC